MTRLIVGLGNPGKQYQFSRHNLGWMVLDQLATDLNLQWSTHKYSLTSKSPDLILAKPTTYMNLSGQAVQKLKAFYKLDNQAITIVYDDYAIDFGDLRIRHSGSDAGHNGLKSVIQAIGEDFWRYRIGIGPKPEYQPTRDFVLANFSDNEVSSLGSIIPATAKYLLDTAQPADTTLRILDLP
ncbi:aminoacyl-tRNA hydrolase [Candidatus Saccharibacteria bacterium]|nr:aminoacyl-tRNA hydrolase [Candidatus Saccharibacteria bacterium]MCB9834912.1 aminoacyl-tRNA hydrolase [Candidatus Nomurabacteria bacterium]